MKKIEGIAYWICRILLKSEVQALVELLTQLLIAKDTLFKKDEPDFPNYRKFYVDAKAPIQQGNKKAHRKNYKTIIKEKGITPINRQKGNKNLPPKKLYCPYCKAPSNYIWINDGKRAGQYRCKVCKETFHPNTKKERISKYFCPYCGYALFLWKGRPFVDIYKCGNKKCSRYIEKYQNLSEKEKQLFKEKPSQFSLHYIYRRYKLNLIDLKINPISLSHLKLARSNNSLQTIGLVLTFYITLQLSSRKTAFALNHIFRIRISHTSVINIAKDAAKICHNFNLANIPKTPGKQAADEKYVKISGKQHYVWLCIAKFRSIITSYLVSDNRGEIPALKTVVCANDKYQPSTKNVGQNQLRESEKHLILITDGNPSYSSEIQYLHTEHDITINHKKVIGLENKDEESAQFRFMKNMIERANRTFKHYVHNCFKDMVSTEYHVALAVTNYNFIRPHFACGYETPVIIKDIKQTHLLQDKWSNIIKMACNF